jgi:hypothetical protein
MSGSVADLIHFLHKRRPDARGIGNAAAENRLHDDELRSRITVSPSNGISDVTMIIHPSSGCV